MLGPDVGLTTAVDFKRALWAHGMLVAAVWNGLSLAIRISFEIGSEVIVKVREGNHLGLTEWTGSHYKTTIGRTTRILRRPPTPAGAAIAEKSGAIRSN